MEGSSVIAAVCGAAISYVHDKITNLRIGMILEMATTKGAVTGALIAGLLDIRILYAVFGLLLLYSAITMLKKS